MGVWWRSMPIEGCPYTGPQSGTGSRSSWSQRKRCGNGDLSRCRTPHPPCPHLLSLLDCHALGTLAMPVHPPDLVPVQGLWPLLSFG
ncbi:Hypothetical protein SMAX5B_016212 [Scophthalmus maximus]|uniref:Uncharacterized protein n=1 Tax=Scophthalmus maximus TaxID=52904 RepID=A0A2U9BL85_SCOMX|nr:Hypothetical protein SMAX5B_016212 [Scophthalmus maximus]